MPPCAMVDWIDWAMLANGEEFWRIEFHFEAIGIAGFGQQRLGLGRIEIILVLVERGPEARRPEGLMDLHAALEERIHHAVIVDEVMHRLAHPDILELRRLHIEADIVQRGLRNGGDDDVLVAGDAGDLVAGEVAGDVDVALLDAAGAGPRVPARGG